MDYCYEEGIDSKKLLEHGDVGGEATGSFSLAMGIRTPSYISSPFFLRVREAPCHVRFNRPIHFFHFTSFPKEEAQLPLSSRLSVLKTAASLCHLPELPLVPLFSFPLSLLIATAARHARLHFAPCVHTLLCLPRCLRSSALHHLLFSPNQPPVSLPEGPC